MNTQHPHEILPEAAVRLLPPAVRRLFVPLPGSAAARLERASPEKRARWLAEHPADSLRLERAGEKRARRALARELGPPPAIDLVLGDVAAQLERGAVAARAP